MDCIIPRLEAEARSSHVKNALLRIAGKRKGKVPPLPALEPSAPSAPTTRRARPRPMEANLRLAILNALVEAGKLVLPALKSRDPYKPDPSILKKVLGLRPTPRDLASLDTLSWEAGFEIQHLIWNQWDGEDDFFDVTRLDGIEVLAGLKRLDLELASITDLSPLIRLASLEHLSVEGQVEDLSPLLGLRKLKSVSVSADRTAENKNVLAELRARKVRVA